MNNAIPRRKFLKQAGLLTAAAAAHQQFHSLRAANSAGNKIVLAVMGANGRGSDLIKGFSALDGVEIGYVCDVDERAIAKGINAAGARQSTAPRGLKDFRRALDDRAVDALVIAAPDHWHAPATILACAAGKHVYVEKPASHNPREGELMIGAARKFNRVVQLGTQRRSMPGVVEAIEKLRAGEIGKVFFSRGWYTNARGSIGRGQRAPVPSWLDYSLWQGPAPEREFRDNVVHYNWHWFWHWGTGELGNNAIHALDVCRWGLGVDFPRHVTSGGGRYHFHDDQETPDTSIVSFDFGDKVIAWEGRSCQPRGIEGSSFGISFHGEKGSLVCDGANYKIYDLNNKEIGGGSGSGSDRPHLQNFFDCIRNNRRPNADIEEGHKSTLLCHLGNIAYRVGGAVETDPRTGHVRNNSAAAALWGRKYRAGWAPVDYRTVKS